MLGQHALAVGVKLFGHSAATLFLWFLGGKEGERVETTRLDKAWPVLVLLSRKIELPPNQRRFVKDGDSCPSQRGNHGSPGE